MSGVAPDPLDRPIELDLVQATIIRLHVGREISDKERGEFEALVEVARAARAAVEHDPDETDGRQHLYDLAAALVRLEGSA